MTQVTNPEWHQSHPIPKRPTASERFSWHFEHRRNCSCRAGTPALKQEIIERQRGWAEPRDAGLGGTEAA